MTVCELAVWMMVEFLVGSLVSRGKKQFARAC
jgi:hypothetical protein